MIGLIGGIASGKSQVGQILAQQGAEIIDTDQIARELVQPETLAYRAIIRHFGDEVLNPDQTLNRSLLRQRIFNHQTDRHWLEGLLHPLIRQVVSDRITQSKAALCVVMIPLLQQRDDYPMLQEVWTVEASEAVRIQRLVQRDNMSVDMAKAMIAAQPDDKMRSQLADVVLQNQDTLADLQINVHNALLAFK